MVSLNPRAINASATPADMGAFVAVAALVDIRTPRRLFAVKPPDGWMLVATLLGIREARNEDGTPGATFPDGRPS